MFAYIINNFQGWVSTDKNLFLSDMRFQPIYTTDGRILPTLETVVDKYDAASWQSQETSTHTHTHTDTRRTRGGGHCRPCTYTLLFDAFILRIIDHCRTVECLDDDHQRANSADHSSSFTQSNSCKHRHQSLSLVENTRLTYSCLTAAAYSKPTGRRASVRSSDTTTQLTLTHCTQRLEHRPTQRSFTLHTAVITARRSI